MTIYFEKYAREVYTESTDYFRIFIDVLFLSFLLAFESVESLFCSFGFCSSPVSETLRVLWNKTNRNFARVNIFVYISIHIESEAIGATSCYYKFLKMAWLCRHGIRNPFCCRLHTCSGYNLLRVFC